MLIIGGADRKARRFAYAVCEVAANGGRLRDVISIVLDLPYRDSSSFPFGEDEYRERYVGPTPTQLNDDSFWLPGQPTEGIVRGMEADLQNKLGRAYFATRLWVMPPPDDDFARGIFEQQYAAAQLPIGTRYYHLFLVLGEKNQPLSLPPVGPAILVQKRTGQHPNQVAGVLVDFFAEDWGDTTISGERLAHAMTGNAQQVFTLGIPSVDPQFGSADAITRAIEEAIKPRSWTVAQDNFPGEGKPFAICVSGAYANSVLPIIDWVGKHLGHRVIIRFVPGNRPRVWAIMM